MFCIDGVSPENRIDGLLMVGRMHSLVIRKHAQPSTAPGCTAPVTAFHHAYSYHVLDDPANSDGEDLLFGVMPPDSSSLSVAEFASKVGVHLYAFFPW